MSLSHLLLSHFIPLSRSSVLQRSELESEVIGRIILKWLRRAVYNHGALSARALRTIERLRKNGGGQEAGGGGLPRS